MIWGLLAVLYIVGIGVYAGACWRLYEKNPDGMASSLGIGAAIWPVMVIVLPIACAVAKIGSRK